MTPYYHWIKILCNTCNRSIMYYQSKSPDLKTQLFFIPFYPIFYNFVNFSWILCLRINVWVFFCTSYIWWVMSLLFFIFLIFGEFDFFWNAFFVLELFLISFFRFHSYCLFYIYYFFVFWQSNFFAKLIS